MPGLVTINSDPDEWFHLAWTEFDESKETLPKSLAARALRMLANDAKSQIRVLQAKVQDFCPGHVASPVNAKVCARCGIHIDELRPSVPESP